MNVQLIVNGRTFPVHYQLLLTIVENIPSGAHYREVARALLALGVPSITANLIKSSAEWLSRQDLDELWAAGDPDIRRSLMAKPEFVKCLTDAQAQDIIHADDPVMLKSVAEMAILLYPAKAAEPEMRLSGAMADALLEHIANSRRPELCQILANSCGTPLTARPAFRKCMESGCDPEKVFSTIQPEDVGLLDGASMESLRHIASDVERIDSQEAQTRVMELLRTYSDPSVRLALARNRQAPRAALELLLEDAEPDVRLSARKSLGLGGDGDEGAHHE